MTISKSTTEKMATDAQSNGAQARGLHLADFLPYQLNVVSQAVSQGLARHYAETFGIAVPEWRIIATLGEFGEMTARDISVHSRMGKVMTSRAANALMARRVLTRRTNRDDRRETFLRLSARGEEIYAALVPKALAYQQRLAEGLAPADLQALERVIAHFMAKSGAGNFDTAVAGGGEA